MDNRIKTVEQDSVICPYCGRDNGQMDIVEERQMNCRSCEREFYVTVTSIPLYTSQKVGPCPYCGHTFAMQDERRFEFHNDARTRTQCPGSMRPDKRPKE